MSLCTAWYVAGRHGKGEQSTLTCGRPGKHLCKDKQAGDTAEQSMLAAIVHVLGAGETKTLGLQAGVRFHTELGHLSRERIIRVGVSPTGQKTSILSG